MATQSFDSAIKVTKKSKRSFKEILNSKKDMTVSRTPVAKDAKAFTLRKLLGK